MDKRKHLVLFDIGSVLVSLDFGKFYVECAKFSKNKSSEQIKQEYVKEGLEGIFLKGLPISQYFDKLINLINPKKPVSDDELRRIFSYRVSGQINGVVNLKKRIHEAGYTVGLFSNTTLLDIEILPKRFPEVYKVFDQKSPVLYSAEHDSVKPEPKMYEMIKGFDSVTFIDDKESYLRTGIEQFEWNGILFTQYIDKEEAIRFAHNDQTKPKKNFKIANSIKELEEALRHFGIEI